MYYNINGRDKISWTSFSWISFIPTAGAAAVGLPQYNICKNRSSEFIILSLIIILQKRYKFFEYNFEKFC